MVINDVVWQKSKMSMLRGTLLIDNNNMAFTKDKEKPTYTSGYTVGSRTYVKKDEYYSQKFDSFLGGVFKKLFGVKEKFSLSCTDVKVVESSVTPYPKYEYSGMTMKAVDGQFTYNAQVKIVAGDAEYLLSKSYDAEDEAKSFECHFK